MRRRRGLWIALAMLAALLLAGDTTYWWFVTQQLDAGFQAWVAAQRGAGWTVRTSPPAFGGWPLAATLTITAVDLSGGDMDFPGGMDWRADRLALRVALLHPQHLEAIPGGTQHLRFGHATSVPFTAEHMQAEVPLQPNEPPHQVILHAINLRIGADAGSTLTVGRLQAAFDDQPPPEAKPALAFSIDADSLALPAQFRWALGSTIPTLRLDGVLTGPFPIASDIRARAAAWRDHGGALVLRKAELNWGPMDLSGDARLGLDAQLQPVGHATARVTGYNATLDALAQADALSSSAALAAKALLSLMAKPAANGKPSEVDVPLRLQHGTLFMRDVPLLRVPVLDWTQP